MTTDDPETARLRAENARLREAIKHYERGLKPLADAVFNDNGDMTVTPIGYDKTVDGYFCYHKARAALAKKEVSDG